ncbi:MAG: amino acid permease [Planctomycetes bacterium]|nr:amino acid permease [Planctomycetota bacterium]
MDNPPASTPSSLPRVLGLWMATAVVIGTVIGSGVFKKPHDVAKNLTEFGLIMIAWVLVGVLSFIGSLILAEVAIIHPRAGGNYAFLREGYGRWAGFLWGWVEFWIIRSGSIAALATVFSETFHDVLRFINDVRPPAEVLTFWQRQGVTIAVITVLAFVNARGTAIGGGLQLVITVVKVGSLLAIALLPFVFLASANSAVVHTEFLDPVWPEDWAGVNWSLFGKALVGILWAYHGWMNLAPVAEEVEEPNRNLPLAFMLGTLSVIVLYVSVNVAYHLIVSRADMIALGGDSPVATIFSFRLFGSIGLLLASLAVMISVFGALNGNLLVGPRLLYAMGQDNLAPEGLSQLHPTYGTPARATAVLAGWSILLVIGAAFLMANSILKKALFDILTDYAMFGAVAFETLAVATIFVCRAQYPVDKVDLPYRCWGYPWLPIVYIGAMALVLINMFVTDLLQSLIAVGFIGVGAGVYAVMVNVRTLPYFLFGACAIPAGAAGASFVWTDSPLMPEWSAFFAIVFGLGAVALPIVVRLELVGKEVPTDQTL